MKSIYSQSSYYHLEEVAFANGIKASDLMAQVGEEVANCIIKYLENNKIIQITDKAAKKSSGQQNQVSHDYSNKLITKPDGGELKIAILCGQGNNGGDGYAVANNLSNNFSKIDIYSNGLPKTDEALMEFTKWQGNCYLFEDFISSQTQYDIIIDAIFGGGFKFSPSDDNTKLPKVYGDLVKKVSQNKAIVFALDAPLGFHIDFGALEENVIKADVTYVLGGLRLAHVMPTSKEYLGRCEVVDLGLESYRTFMDDGGSFCPSKSSKFIIEENTAYLWQALLNTPKFSHKYQKGSVLVFGGGGWSSGAARMAAMSALASKAGVVTIACPREARDVYASQLTSVMLSPVDTKDEFYDLLEEKKVNSIVIGPGFGRGHRTKTWVEEILKSDVPCILDADAIRSFSSNPEHLFKLIKQSARPVILTPHLGEFISLFPDFKPLRLKGAAQQTNIELFSQNNRVLSKFEAALLAAKRSGATIIFKGVTTVVASPNDVDAIYQTGDIKALATAGSGDVLAGIVASFLARLNVYEDPIFAAAAGVGIHFELGKRLLEGTLAEDFYSYIPSVIEDLR